MLVDLDHFKDINDTLGHHVGDGLLREVANRLTSALPALTIARLGGDEFAVLVPEVTSRDDVLSLAEQAMTRLREPVVAEGIRLGVHASIGVALYPDDAQDLHTLVQRADVALYPAKRVATTCRATARTSTHIPSNGSACTATYTPPSTVPNSAWFTSHRWPPGRAGSWVWKP